jgi:protease II
VRTAQAIAWASATTLLWEEDDERFRLGVWRSWSRALILRPRPFTTTEHRYLPGSRRGVWRTILPPREGSRAQVDHGRAASTSARTRGRRNFRLVAAPDDDPAVVGIDCCPTART